MGVAQVSIEAVGAVYFGDYGKMHPAHGAAKAEATRHGRLITGASWEIYDDWSDGAQTLRTDIYHLLRDLAHD